MYGVVLMAALTTSTAAPDCHRSWGGCYGGSSSCYGGYGCYGSGYGYGGCYGGGCYGISSYGSGCYGSSYGYSGYGCYGSGYGAGCYGSGYGAGCYGGVWGCYGGAGYGSGWGSGCGGCYGCYGGYAGYGVNVLPTYADGIYGNTPNMLAPGVMNPSTTTPGTTIPGTTVPGTVAPGGKTPEVAPSPLKTSRAKVRIEVPANAKLYIDGQLMRTASTQRIFQTPDLNPGQTYFYDVRVELESAGQTLSESQRILVRPGSDAIASFAGMEQRAGTTATARTQD